MPIAPLHKRAPVLTETPFGKPPVVAEAQTGRKHVFPSYMSDADAMLQRGRRLRSEGKTVDNVVKPKINQDGKLIYHHVTEDHFKQMGDYHALHLNKAFEAPNRNKRPEYDDDFINHYYATGTADRKLAALQHPEPFKANREINFFDGSLLRHNTMAEEGLIPDKFKSLVAMEDERTFWRAKVQEKIKSQLKMREGPSHHGSAMQIDHIGRFPKQPSSDQVQDRRGSKRKSEEEGGRIDGAHPARKTSRAYSTSKEKVRGQIEKYSALSDRLSQSGDKAGSVISEMAINLKEDKALAFKSPTEAKKQKDHYGHIAEEHQLRLKDDTLADGARARLTKDQENAEGKRRFWATQYQRNLEEQAREEYAAMQSMTGHMDNMMRER
jgi:hypothetical protein